MFQPCFLWSFSCGSAVLRTNRTSFYLCGRRKTDKIRRFWSCGVRTFLRSNFYCVEKYVVRSAVVPHKFCGTTATGFGLHTLIYSKIYYKSKYVVRSAAQVLRYCGTTATGYGLRTFLCSKNYCVEKHVVTSSAVLRVSFCGLHITINQALVRRSFFYRTFVVFPRVVGGLNN